MFRFVYEKYGKAYILELIRDSGKTAAETPRLYEEAISQTKSP